MQPYRASPSSLAYRIAILGWQRIEKIQQHQRNTDLPNNLRTANISSERIVLAKILQKADAILDDDSSKVYLSLLLSSAPPELCDPALALKYSQIAAEQKPVELVLFAHSWALYRNGQWQAALDICPKDNGKKAESDAVIAMALWQLGRREEAREWFAGSFERLKMWEVWSKRAKSNGSLGLMPLTGMLRVLHNEAAAMLGVSEEKKQPATK